jgi:cation:H+ antiporter
MRSPPAPVSAVLLALSFGILLGGAVLFTNAIEWLGRRLALGQGAVGSILAAVATALPESLIPVVALVAGTSGAGDVATGAIVGAPFMLATIAMALVGISTLAYRHRRPQGRALRVHLPTLRRDLAVFLAFFGLALLLGAGAPGWLRVAAAIAFVLAYADYVRRTLQGGGEVGEHHLAPLLFDRRRPEGPRLALVLLQVAAALGAIVGGAHLFVQELLAVADGLGVEPLVLSLVLAPLATELPEKLNSVLWTRQGKDTLALGNITGAMVFQSTVPVAIGLAFTTWELDRFAVIAIALGLAGGALALATLRRGGRFGLAPVAGWVGLYASFVVVVVAG